MESKKEVKTKTNKKKSSKKNKINKKSNKLKYQYEKPGDKGFSWLHETKEGRAALKDLDSIFGI